MKSVIIIIAGCISFAFVMVKSRPNHDDYYELRTECLRLAFNWSLDTSAIVSRTRDCFFKKLEILGDDGEVDLPKLKRYEVEQKIDSDLLKFFNVKPPLELFVTEWFNNCTLNVATLPAHERIDQIEICFGDAYNQWLKHNLGTAAVNK